MAKKNKKQKSVSKVNQGSTREGNLIKSVDFNLTFQIPIYWVKWYEENEEKPNIHLTQSELSLIKDAEGDWDEEFAIIVNSILPFNQCIAHVGREGWGKNGISYIDLQVRAYILLTSKKGLEKTIIKKGKTTIEKIIGESVLPEIENFGEWKKVLFKYSRFYEDYGAGSIVDVRFKQHNDLTVVFVFMYTDHKDISKEIEGILKSATF